MFMFCVYRTKQFIAGVILSALLFFKFCLHVLTLQNTIKLTFYGVAILPFPNMTVFCSQTR